VKPDKPIAALSVIVAAATAIVALIFGTSDTTTTDDSYIPAIRQDTTSAWPMTMNMAITALDEALDIVPPLTAAGILASHGWDCLPYPEHRDTWAWTPPTTGAPVDHYVVEFTWTTTDTAFQFWIQGSDTQWVRVAGVDSLGRQGEWSDYGVWP